MIDRSRFDGEPERLPPSNLAAEAALLGSVLLDASLMDRLGGVAAARDFYRPAHADIFAAMLALHDAGEPIDYLTVAMALDRDGRTQAVGVLAGLITEVPTPIHGEFYAQAVAEAGLMRRLISAGSKIVQLGYGRDAGPELALEKAEQLLLEVAATRSTASARPMDELLRAYIERLELAQSGQAISAAVPTGFHDLDHLLSGGLKRGDLAILAARPGNGKTSLAACIAANAALTYKAGAAVFSLEMGADQITERLLASQARIETTRLAHGRMTDAEAQRLGSALGRLAEAAVVVDDTGSLTPGELRARVRRISAETPLDLVIVDHINLMSGPRGAGTNRVQEMTEISRQLKLLAREQGVAVLALCQLSRAVEQRNPKIPIMSDLRESGSIEQDADVVAFIYRDAYYDRNSERGDVADLIIAKHRNGPTGQVSLHFDAKTTRFFDMESGPSDGPWWTA